MTGLHLINMEKFNAGTKEENLESKSKIEEESLEIGGKKHIQMSKLFGSEAFTQSMSFMRILQRKSCDKH